MEMLDRIRRLWEHAVWADTRLLEALGQTDNVPAEALREYAHVLGSEALWLARLEQRPPQAAVWPAASFAQVQELLKQTHAGYMAYLSTLDGADLDRMVTYTNSTGQTFTTSVGDILLHVALHGQYHRGKVNLLLRQSACVPVPTDYIAFVKAPPEHLDTRIAVPLPGQESPQSGDPHHGDLQGGGAVGYVPGPVNLAVQGLPLWIRQATCTGSVGLRAGHVGEIQQAPGHHGINRQSSVQTVDCFQLKLFHLATAFQGVMVAFNLQPASARGTSMTMLPTTAACSTTSHRCCFPLANCRLWIARTSTSLPSC